MNTQRPRGFEENYGDGLDDEVGRATVAARPQQQSEMLSAKELAALRKPSEVSRPVWFDVQLMSVPLFAGFMFGICGALAAGSVEFTLRRFAEEVGMNRAIFVAVPAMFSMMFAIFVYQKARAKITRVSQSISRGLLVALMTWAAFSALATWTWCLPENYGTCYGNILLVSGLVGGGPMLIAALVAGALVGWLIKQQRLGWIME